MQKAGEVHLTRRSGVCRLCQTKLLAPSTSPAAVPAELTGLLKNTFLPVSLSQTKFPLCLIAHPLPRLHLIKSH